MKAVAETAYIRACAYCEGEGAEKIAVSLKIKEQQSAHSSLTACGVSADDAGVFGSELWRRNINKIYTLELELTAEEECIFPQTALELRIPIDSTQSIWLPGMLSPAKNVRAFGFLEHSKDVDMMTHICNLLPAGAMYSAEGVNKLSYALLECKDPVKIEPGVYSDEEGFRLFFRFFTVPGYKMSSYRTILRLDSSFVPVFEAVKDISSWYEKELQLDAMQVPESALEPVYSTWYSMLQNLSDEKIEKECEIASRLGCRTVIVDDGWQTDDNNRGYAYCGDWQVSAKRFPDFKAHVKKIHDLGMKYMLWLSVPFMGKKAANYEFYKDYILNYNPRWDACTLDPRYKKVRDFLVGTYVRLVKDYELDGLKLDFIDEFTMRVAEGKALEFDPERDTQSMSEAVDMLMREVRSSLEKLNPDILIEFRQNYIGPMIRTYGNMLRAHDCPYDTLMNRMSITSLRATSAHTAVHSDMYIWGNNDSIEAASLNFIHTLFSVPQISPVLSRLNDSHLKMTAHWLGFMRENRDLLLRGDIEALYPECCFGQIRGIKDDQEIIAECAGKAVSVFSEEKIKKSTVVNGAMTEYLLLKSPAAMKCRCEIFNCLGEKTGEEELALNSTVSELKLPKSGYCIMTAL